MECAHRDIEANFNHLSSDDDHIFSVIDPLLPPIALFTNPLVRCWSELSHNVCGTCLPIRGCESAMKENHLDALRFCCRFEPPVESLGAGYRITDDERATIMVRKNSFTLHSCSSQFK